MIPDPLASLAPMCSMGSRLRDTRKGIIFCTSRVDIPAERPQRRICRQIRSGDIGGRPHRWKL